MAITVKHTKVSTIPDGADTDLVRPSDWNADHTLTGLGTMAEQNANNVAITGGTITGVTGLGDVAGPASSTDNAVARYDSTTGKIIQNSVVIVGDTGIVTGVTELTASTKVASPYFDATTSAGGALRNAGGTAQIQWGAGGGNNVSVDVSTNLNGTNAQIDISPTGTGHVHIKPTGSGSLEIAPTSAGTMNNMSVGQTTAAAGKFTDFEVTGTFKVDNAEGVSGQVLTSQGTGVTPIWTTPTTGTVTSVTGTAPIASSGGTTPAISISQATTSTDGYLSSTDWNTFNNKQPAGSYLTSVTADSPLSGSGTSGSHLVIAQATTSTSGYLSSTDWNTFNNKATYPSQTGNNGKFLKTDGSAVSWASLPTYMPVLTNAGTTTNVTISDGYLPVLTNGGSTVNVAVS